MVTPIGPSFLRASKNLSKNQMQIIKNIYLFIYITSHLHSGGKSVKEWVGNLTFTSIPVYLKIGFLSSSIITLLNGRIL